MDAAELPHLVRAVAVAAQARANGNHPFGAILVTADGTLVEAENTVVTERDPTGHAETNLVRLSAARLSASELSGATLYTSTEPCAMCCGAIFWAGIPRVVFALSEKALLALVPAESGEGLLDLPSRDVFSRGSRVTQVIGPVSVEGATEVHAGFWT